MSQVLRMTALLENRVEGQNTSLDRWWLVGNRIQVRQTVKILLTKEVQWTPSKLILFWTGVNVRFR